MCFLKRQFWLMKTWRDANSKLIFFKNTILDSIFLFLFRKLYLSDVFHVFSFTEYGYFLTKNSTFVLRKNRFQLQSPKFDTKEDPETNLWSFFMKKILISRKKYYLCALNTVTKQLEFNSHLDVSRKKCQMRLNKIEYQIFKKDPLIKGTFSCKKVFIFKKEAGFSIIT